MTKTSGRRWTLGTTAPISILLSLIVLSGCTSGAVSTHEAADSVASIRSDCEILVSDGFLERAETEFLESPAKTSDFLTNLAAAREKFQSAHADYTRVWGQMRSTAVKEPISKMADGMGMLSSVVTELEEVFSSGRGEADQAIRLRKKADDAFALMDTGAREGEAACREAYDEDRQ